MMRMFAAVLALWQFLVPAPVAASGSGSSAAIREPCSSESGRSSAREQRTFDCTLTSSQGDQRFRFAITFLGSHDDTTLAMTATLDGSPIVCDVGSKIESEGEFGDVLLVCRFRLAQSDAARRLRVNLTWYHASLGSYELVPE